MEEAAQDCLDGRRRSRGREDDEQIETVYNNDKKVYVAL